MNAANAVAARKVRSVSIGQSRARGRREIGTTVRAPLAANARSAAETHNKTRSAPRSRPTTRPSPPWLPTPTNDKRPVRGARHRPTLKTSSLRWPNLAEDFVRSSPTTWRPRGWWVYRLVAAPQIFRARRPRRVTHAFEVTSAPRRRALQTRPTAADWPHRWSARSRWRRHQPCVSCARGGAGARRGHQGAWPLFVRERAQRELDAFKLRGRSPRALIGTNERDFLHTTGCEVSRDFAKRIAKFPIVISQDSVECHTLCRDCVGR